MAAPTRRPAAVAKPSRVAINLDTLEREVTYEPFTFVLNGRPYTLVDPHELPWDVLVGLQSAPMSFLRAAVGESPDSETILAELGKLPGWKINEIAGAYSAHFGLLNAEKAPASSTS